MSAQPVRHRFTADEYHGIGDAGLFPPDQRLELLAGEVIEMAPIGNRHAAMVKRLNRIFSEAVGDRIEGATDPAADDYRKVRQVGPGGNVTPHAFRDVTLAVTNLLA